MNPKAHDGKPIRDPAASGRPDMKKAFDTAAAEFGNPVISNVNSPEYSAALGARDDYWRSMPEGLPNAQQTEWLTEGWRRFYVALGYKKV